MITLLEYRQLKKRAIDDKQRTIYFMDHSVNLEFLLDLEAIWGEGMAYDYVVEIINKLDQRFPEEIKVEMISILNEVDRR